jgi:hypothetical protein
MHTHTQTHTNTHKHTNTQEAKLLHGWLRKRVEMNKVRERERERERERGERREREKREKMHKVPPTLFCMQKNRTKPYRPKPEPRYLLLCFIYRSTRSLFFRTKP